MTDLSPGQNAPLAAGPVTVTAAAGADLIALVLSDDGKVSGDADMIFFNQPSGAGVVLSGQVLTVTPAALRPGASKVVLVGSVDVAGSPIGTVSVADTAGQHLSFTPTGLTSERAVVLVELYQRDGVWKVRAVGQGYADGLAGLARDYGVSVAEEKADEPAPAPISLIKGEERLPPEQREKLNLRKDLVKISLEKRGAKTLEARVIAVLDTSGSTAGLYNKGVFTRAIERVVAVAAAVDDDAELQAFAMGSSCQRLDDLQVGDLPQWTQRWTRKRPKEAGGSNNEAAAFEVVSRYVATQDGDVPTLVLWFHDGGVTDNKGTERAVRAAVEQPVFWQFIGLGRASYGILERLDTLSGRRVDNTGFFALDDIDEVSDAELYERLLDEFPSWVRAFYPPTHPAVAGMNG